MGKSDFSVNKVSRKLGVFADTTLYEVRGASLEEVTQALDLIHIRDSAHGRINKVHELDLSAVFSIALTRPLSIPTGIVYKNNKFYAGGGIFGPVWGRFSAEQRGDTVVIKDKILGSPFYRAGHHLFAYGVQAITTGLERERVVRKPPPDSRGCGPKA